MNNQIQQIAQLMKANDGLALCVGGFVRDSILGLAPKDVDIEVYKINPDRLVGILTDAGFEIDLVGKSFGVVKIKNTNIDISLPRRENKRGLGHKGFAIMSDHNMSVKEAASRRDFTFNSMALDPLTGELFDFFGGMEDLENKVIRHTSDQFSEDPLRVLRAMQFAARFNFAVNPATASLCGQLDLHELPLERIFEEFSKMILKGVNIRAGLTFLKDSGAVRFFPELQAMVGCEQEHDFHPEGDVFEHTGHVCNFFAQHRVGEETEDLIVGLAALCHDMGKPSTTVVRNGKITAYGHDEAGKVPTRSFLNRLTNRADLHRIVPILVATHMRPGALFHGTDNPSDQSIRRLSIAVDGRIDLLARLCAADNGGRPPIEFNSRVSTLLLTRSSSLGLEREKPKPIIQGRHLIELGLKPSKKFGEILKQAFEAQISDCFSTEEGGISFVKEFCERNLYV